MWQHKFTKKHTQTLRVAARHRLVLFRKKYLLGPFCDKRTVTFRVIPNGSFVSRSCNCFNYLYIII